MKFDKLVESFMENTDNASNNTQKPDPRGSIHEDEAYEAIKNGVWSKEDFSIYLQEVIDNDRYNSV